MKNKDSNYCFSAEERLRAFANIQYEKNHFNVDFSESIQDLNEESLGTVHCRDRFDLRNIPSFTIDCDNTKDMDDAISLERKATGYRLGVHIADVATYITPGSPLDVEAISRGTSLYLPHQTVPMLPQMLSNDLCSLNPGVDRLTVSLLIDLDNDGIVKDYCIHKSTIHSRLKGSYSEVNNVLMYKANKKITTKYSEVSNTLFEMRELASKLREIRSQCGANVSNDDNNKIVVNGWSMDIIHYQNGDAEHIVEEFMVLANRLIAEYFLNQNLPVVYRVQRKKRMLATYTTEPINHAELALEHYAHFTSPIRRLADLKIHQILAAHLEGMDSVAINTTFAESLAYAAEKAIKKMRQAKSIQAACTKFCIKLWAEMQPEELYPAQMIGRDFHNNAIIEILPYHIKALGAAGIRAYKGEMLSCKLQTNPLNNKLTAIVVRRQPRTLAA